MRFKERIKENASFIIKKPKLIFPLIRNYFFLVVGKKPLRTVEIALTYKCPYNCKYCSATAYQDKNMKELTLSEYKSIIDESIRLGAIHFLFTGGEPLLSKKLFILLNHVKRKGKLSSIATNGLLINKTVAIKLKDCGISLVEVSIDSIKKTDHDNFREYKGAHNKSIIAIKNLKEQKIKTIINHVIRKKNINEFKPLYDLSKELGVGINLGFSCAVGNWQKKVEVILNKNELNITDKYLKLRNVRWCGDSCYAKKGCSAGLEKIYMTPYGDITPCPLIPKIFGNTKKQKLSEILKEIRKNNYFNQIQKRCLPSHDKKFLKKLE